MTTDVVMLPDGARLEIDDLTATPIRLDGSTLDVGYLGKTYRYRWHDEANEWRLEGELTDVPAAPPGAGE